MLNHLLLFTQFVACFADPVPDPTGFLRLDTNGTDSPSSTPFLQGDNSACWGNDGPICSAEDSPGLLIASSADSLRANTFGDFILTPRITGNSGMATSPAQNLKTSSTAAFIGELTAAQAGW